MESIFKNLKILRDGGDEKYQGLSDDDLRLIAKKEYDRQNTFDSILNGVGTTAGLIGSIGEAASLGDDSFTSEEKGIFSGFKGFGSMLSSTGNPLLSVGAGVGSGLASYYSDVIDKEDKKLSDYYDSLSDTYNSTVSFAEDGGQVVAGQDIPVSDLIPIQTEKIDKGEVISTLSGSVYDAHSDKRHTKMDDDEITDNLNVGDYIFPEKFRIKAKDLDMVVGYTPSYYSENKKGNRGSEKITLRDYFESGIRMSEAAREVKRMYKVRKDGVIGSADKKTNEENIRSRIPILAALKKLNDKYKGAENEVATENIQKFVDGGTVVYKGDGFTIQKYDQDDVNSLPYYKKVDLNGNYLGDSYQMSDLLEGENPESIEKIDIGGVDLGEQLLNIVRPDGRTITSPEEIAIQNKGVTFDAPNITYPVPGIEPIDKVTSLGLMSDQLSELQESRESLPGERQDYLDKADKAYSGIARRNAVSTIVDSAGKIIGYKEDKAPVKKAFLRDTLNPSAIDARIDKIYGTGLNVIRGINESGGNINDVISSNALAEIIKQGGAVSNNFINQNKKIIDANKKALVDTENINIAAQVTVDNTNKKRRADLINSLSRNFAGLSSAANRLSINRLETESEINKAFDIKGRNYDIEISKLNALLASGELTKSEYDLKLAKVESLKDVLNVKLAEIENKTISK